MISATPHPDTETLLRLVDDDLPPTESAAVEQHLSTCAACREQSRILRETLGDYFQFHATVLKPSLPPVPREWDRLETLMTEPPKGRVLFFRPRVWLAVAAAIALTFFVIRRFEHTPAVDAAELLTRAAVAETSATAPHRGRILIRTRHAKWERPAKLVTPAAGEALEVQKLLISAGYPSEDPLSASAFFLWRQGLPEKHDQVTEEPGGGSVERYLVQTTTGQGPVADASLTLRAKDLHAINCTLHLRSEETIVMTEVPDEVVLPSIPTVPSQPITEPKPEGVPTRAGGPAEELQVVAALHRIGADLGEPIEVRRDDAGVHVSVSGVIQRRQDEVRAALSGIPGVEIRSGADAAHDVRAGLPPRRNVVQPDSPSPLVAELQSMAGNGIAPAELANQLIDSTDSAIERAYALRGLAKRFPQETSAQMSAAERATLNGILRDHVEKLAQSIDALQQSLAPVLPGAGDRPSPSAAPDSWQNLVESLLTSVQQIDRELNATAQANSDLTGRKARLRQALGNLRAEIASLRRLVQP